MGGIQSARVERTQTASKVIPKSLAWVQPCHAAQTPQPPGAEVTPTPPYLTLGIIQVFPKTSQAGTSHTRLSPKARVGKRTEGGGEGGHTVWGNKGAQTVLETLLRISPLADCTVLDKVLGKCCNPGDVLFFPLEMHLLSRKDASTSSVCVTGKQN